MPAPEALRTIETVGSASAAVCPRNRNQRRRVIDHLQPRRIAELTKRHECDAKFFGCSDLVLRIGARANLRRGARAAAPCQRRQRFKGGARPAEMIDQGAKGARADVRATDGRSQSNCCSSVRWTPLLIWFTSPPRSP